MTQLHQLLQSIGLDGIPLSDVLVYVLIILVAFLGIRLGPETRTRRA